MKEEKETTMKVGDILFFVIVLLLAWLFLLFTKSDSKGQYIHITVQGEAETYSLLEEQVITLGIDSDRRNVLVVEEGQAYMKSADCPDQVCVHHKPISKNGEMIICLPNEVFVEIESDAEKDIDN